MQSTGAPCFKNTAALLVVIFTVLSISIQAATYYVSESGDDDASGLSEDSAWASIDNGDQEDILIPGDTVIVLAGTYSPASTIQLSTDGNSTSPVVYLGEGKNKTIIDYDGRVSTIINIESNYLKLIGIELHNSGAKGIQVNGSNIEVRECYIHDTEEEGIRIAGSSCLIYRNVVANCVSGDGFYVESSADSNLFHHNIAYSCAGTGFELQSSSTRIINSISSLNDIGINGNSGNTCAYNDVWGNATNDYSGGAVDSAGGISEDPKLISPVSHNYNLKGSSPCVNAGIDLGYDFNSSAPDIGAFESNFGGANQPPRISPINSKTVYEGDTLSFEVSSSDQNDDPITLSAENLPDNAVFVDNDDGSGDFEFIPDFNQAGEYTVSFFATDGSLTDTAEVDITVILDPISYIIISPDSVSVPVDSTIQFNISGYSSTDESRDVGSITWSLTENLGNINDSGLFRASSPGTGKVIAESDLGPVDTSDFLEVTSGVPAYIDVIPEEYTINETSSYQFRAYSYDTSSNFIDEITASAEWSTDDPTGTVSSSGVYTAGNSLSPPAYYVKASWSGFNDSSTVSVISSGSLYSIQIEFEDGTPVDDLSLTTDNDTTKLYCRGYDSGENLIGNIAVTWSIIGPDSVGSLDTGVYSKNTVTLAKPGNILVRAFYSTELQDTTGQFSVSAGALAQLEVSPDSIETIVGDTVNFAVNGFDNDSNSIDPGIVSWDVLGSVGSIDSDGSFIAKSVGPGQILAFNTDSSVVDTNTAVVVVEAGILKTLVVTPDTVSLRVGESATFNARGFDAGYDSTGVGTVSWQVLGEIGAIDSGGQFTASSRGTGKIIATSNLGGKTDTTRMIVVEVPTITGIPLGSDFIYPGQNQKPVLAFNIQNSFDDIEAINSVTVRNIFYGSGSATQKHSNFDSIAFYLDANNNQLFDAYDTRLAGTASISSTSSFSFADVSIEPGGNRNFFVTADTDEYPHDGDSIDILMSPGSDIQTVSGLKLAGADTINSLGYLIIDGLTSQQIRMTSSGNSYIGSASQSSLVMTVDLPRNGYESDTLNNISLYNAGNADTSDIDALSLYKDDGDNIWEGGGTETFLGQFQFTGDQWSLSGLSSILTETQNRFYVTASIADYPNDRATLAYGITHKGIEMSSDNDGPIDSKVAPVDTITIKVSDALLVSGIELEEKTLAPNNSTGPLLITALTNRYTQDVYLDSIRFTIKLESAGMPDAQKLYSQIETVRLWQKLNGDYTEIEDQDILIASKIVTGENVTFNTNALTLPKTGEEIILAIELQLTEMAKNGNSISISISQANHLYYDEPTALSGSFPIQNTDAWVIDAFPSSMINTNTISGMTLFGGQEDKLVLDIELPPDGYDVPVLQKVKLINAGTAITSEALSTIKLWRDLDNDSWDENDEMIGYFQKGSDAWEIANINQSFSSESNRFLVTVDVAQGDFQGGSIKLEIPVEGILYSSGTAGPDDKSVQNPESHFVLPGNRITVISIPLEVGFAHPGKDDVSLLTFALYNGYTTQSNTLEEIRLTNTGPAVSTLSYSDYELGQISIYYDQNNNRTFDEEDPLLAAGYMQDGKLSLGGLNVNLDPETLSYFFIKANLPLGLIDSDTLQVSLLEKSDLVFSEVVNLNGDLPIDRGGILVVDGSIKRQYSLVSPPTQILSPGDETSTIFAFKPPANGNQADYLQSLTLSNVGSAGSDDINTLQLWLDVNADDYRQNSDQLMGQFSYVNSQYVIDDLDIQIDTDPSALFVTCDVANEATRNSTIQLSLPLDGCKFSSDNDGPLDSTLQYTQPLIISPSGLKVSYNALRSSYAIGQDINLKVTVDNQYPYDLNNVDCNIIMLGDSNSVQQDSSFTGPARINASQSEEFYITYNAMEAGQIQWQIQAISNLTNDSSAVLRTENIQIQTAPDMITVDLVSSIPPAVIRGQSHVYPLSLKYNLSESSQSSSPIRLDTLILNIEDQAGDPIPADQVFSRMVLATSYNTLAIKDTLPQSNEIKFVFQESAILYPDQSQLLSLMVDIDSSASPGSFRLYLQDANSIPFVEFNSSMRIDIDPEVQFPLRTAYSRIDVPTEKVKISYANTLGNTANYGQSQVNALSLVVTHPGSEYSSQAQLTGLEFELITESNNRVRPFEILERVDIVSRGIPIGTMTSFPEYDSVPFIQLNAPPVFSPGETDTFDIVISLKEEMLHSSIGLKITDSTYFEFRDLSSGNRIIATSDLDSLLVDVIFPIYSSIAQLKKPAGETDICLDSRLSTSVTVGAKNVVLYELNCSYLMSDEFSGLDLTSIKVAVVDSANNLLNPNDLFDRIGYLAPDSTAVYQQFIETRNNQAVFMLGNDGIYIEPASSQKIFLVADIEGATPFNEFGLVINQIPIIRDATDSSHLPLINVSHNCDPLPVATAICQVLRPSGQPDIMIEEQSVRIGFAGQDRVGLFTAELSYISATPQGDLRLKQLAGKLLKKDDAGISPIQDNSEFDSIHLNIDGQEVAFASLEPDGSFILYPTVEFEVSHNNSYDLEITCNLNNNVSAGNYVLQFQDSTFIQFEEYSGSEIIYAHFADISFPLTGGNLSVLQSGLKNSFTNYPNPFKPSMGESTTIAFVLSADADVTIEIFSLTGGLVRRLVFESPRIAGSYQSDSWDGNSDDGNPVISGTYICQIVAEYPGGKVESYRRKMAIIR